MRHPVRHRILQCHRWTGLSLGLIMVLIAVTGAGMVFRPQLDPIINRDQLRVTACHARLPLDALIANAHAANPQGGALTYIRLYSATDSVARIRFSDDKWVNVNPCSGAVLGQDDRYGGLFGTLALLHSLRFVANGNLIAGALTLALIVMLILGGLVVWWSGTRYSGRKPSFRAYPQQLHKTIAPYASLILLTSALTGLPQAFEWCRNGIYLLTGSPLPASVTQSVTPTGAQRLPTEFIWQRALSLLPQASQAQLHFSGKPGDAVDIRLVGSDAPHAQAFSYLTLNPYTGQVLHFTPYAKNSLGEKIYLWALSLHYGWVAGWFGQLLLLAGALSVPVLAYTGISSYLSRRYKLPAGKRLLLRVNKKTVEAEGVCSFELVDPAGKRLPPFSPGAHIDVYLRAGLVRQYSLCNDPRERHRYLIAVLRTPDSRGGSQAMHDDFEEGSALEIGTPRNHFQLAPRAQRSLLIAGGIGITPILSMAEQLTNTGADFSMHYCSRSLQRTAFHNRINSAAYAQRVRFHFSDGMLSQRVDLQTLLADPDPATHLYVCGPAGFMDAVIDTAKSHGWCDSRLHREYFSAALNNSDSDVEFDIKLASTGKIYRVAKDKTAAAALSEAGVQIPTMCEQGVCGTCLTRVLDGEPDHRDRFLSEADRMKNDLFLPCCSRSNSATLVLDL
ncbi:PepSY domain-containing protein [Collimonas silvisoli]|uniref:PepSY domain-containing protein n=1 Tax=Collimonas silvisoli TaxID=2825884 RepID=UPI001B8A9C62|nr:PepSY domain-containing protein [Collimonas silvisoli]